MIAASAQFPGKPVRIISPFAAGGGGSDIITRIVAQRMSEDAGTTGTAVVVESKAGAGGRIGYDAGAKSPAEGGAATTVYARLQFNQRFGCELRI